MRIRYTPTNEDLPDSLITKGHFTVLSSDPTTPIRIFTPNDSEKQDTAGGGSVRPAAVRSRGCISIPHVLDTVEHKMPKYVFRQ